MTDRTWVGGHHNDNVLSADNWNPAGVPKAGDNLIVTNGTVAIAHTDLSGDTLNLKGELPSPSIELDLNGGARVNVSNVGESEKIINVTGSDRLNAISVNGLNGLGGLDGTIDLADHAHLVVTGQIGFGYTESLTGPADSVLVNDGSIRTEDGTVSVPVRGTGTLGFSGYHDGRGFSSINAPISVGQTIDLNPEVFGMTLTLSDPASFHGTLNISEPPFQSSGDVAVVLQGIEATSFDLKGDHILLKDGHRTVDTIRVADLGSVSVSGTRLA